MSMEKCKICGAFIYSWNHKNNSGYYRPHICTPMYLTQIYDYDGEDDWITIYTEGFPSSAATKRAAIYDSDEYGLLDGEEIEIHVKDSNGKITKFNCTGESVPKYSATKIS